MIPRAWTFRRAPTTLRRMQTDARSSRLRVVLVTALVIAACAALGIGLFVAGAMWRART